jgi:hypothetical protein
MRRITRRRLVQRSYQMVQLERETLYEIVGLMKSACESLAFRTAHYELDDITEIEEFDTPIRFVSIESSNPHFKLTLYNDRVNMETYEDEIKAMGVFARIDSIMKGRRYRWRFLSGEPFAPFAIVLGLVCLALSPAPIIYRKDYGLPLLVIGVLLLTITALAIWKRSRWDIVLPDREDKPRYDRHEVQLVVVTACVTTCVTLFFTEFLPWVLKLMGVLK